MSFKWRSEFAIENEMVDYQHKELYRTLSDLVEAGYTGKDFDAIISTMNFLIERTVKHFSDEEALQQSINFPDYQNHKKSHEVFKLKAAELREELKAKGGGNALLMKTVSTIGEWLTNHIRKEDKKIGEYIEMKNGLL